MYCTYNRNILDLSTTTSVWNLVSLDGDRAYVHSSSLTSCGPTDQTEGVGRLHWHWLPRWGAERSLGAPPQGRHGRTWSLRRAWLRSKSTQGWGSSRRMDGRRGRDRQPTRSPPCRGGKGKRIENEYTVRAWPQIPYYDRTTELVRSKQKPAVDLSYGNGH